MQLSNVLVLQKGPIYLFGDSFGPDPPALLLSPPSSSRKNRDALTTSTRGIPFWALLYLRFPLLELQPREHRAQGKAEKRLQTSVSGFQSSNTPPETLHTWH